MKSIESLCLLLLGKQVFHKPHAPVIYVIIKEKNDMMYGVLHTEAHVYV